MPLGEITVRTVAAGGHSRVEPFNLTNRVTLAGGRLTRPNAAFGISSQANTPRLVKSDLRLGW
jgi:hypothetical protein